MPPSSCVSDSPTSGVTRSSIRVRALRLRDRRHEDDGRPHATTGTLVAEPSYYKPGDYSLPHSDHKFQRTVAFVWHLSKRWRPEWGGSLYWAQRPLTYAPPSFNTLYIFTVSTASVHFVSPVTPYAEEKRLCFNGWWQASWEPHSATEVEAMLQTEEQRRRVTAEQYSAIRGLLSPARKAEMEPEQRQRLTDLVAKLPPMVGEALVPHMDIDAYNGVLTL